MKIDDSTCDGIVGDLVAIVHQDEEQVKSAHDGGRHVDVLLEALTPVIATSIGIGSSQYTCPSGKGNQVKSK